MTSAMLQHACLARGAGGSTAGLMARPELSAAFWGTTLRAEGGDSRCAKDDELCDTAAIEQVDGKLHQDARGIGRSPTGGELGIVLECRREGMVSGGTQQAESKECHAAQDLERKRGRRELNLSQAHDDDRDGDGVGGCQ